MLSVCSSAVRCAGCVEQPLTWCKFGVHAATHSSPEPQSRAAVPGVVVGCTRVPEQALLLLLLLHESKRHTDCDVRAVVCFDNCGKEEERRQNGRNDFKTRSDARPR